MSTDDEWEKWGKQDPYFGVITAEKFRSKNLNESSLVEFFESGEKHVRHVVEVSKQHLNEHFSPKHILDFGCGTGRLVIPFSRIADRVVGLDVSESMLNEARKNCEKYSATNVDLRKSDDDLSEVRGEFDLVHSCIVFQHIPFIRGRQIFSNLLSYLKDGGVCAIQLTYAKSIYKDTLGIAPSSSSLPPPNNHLLFRSKAFMRKLLGAMKPKGRKKTTDHQRPVHSDPEMQMNSYDLNVVFFIIQSMGIETIHVEFTDHGGELGTWLFFKKPGAVHLY